MSRNLFRRSFLASLEDLSDVDEEATGVGSEPCQHSGGE